MALIRIPAGLVSDRPVLSASPYWRSGFNVRISDGAMETLGLFAPLRNGAGTHLTMPGSDKCRMIFPTPGQTEGQIIAASASQVRLLDFDPASTPGTGTRWRDTDIKPALAATADVVGDPSPGRVEIPPVWWFDDTEDVVVGSRANVVGEPVYAWDRNRASSFVALANSPTGAVGGGIIGRILVLLGCTSFTDPDPKRFMVVRWSTRFNFEDWTPTDINLSGELLLEGGSRIMGGGVVGRGVVVWTDKRMAVLTETGDPDSVFARRYVDGGRGLMANRSWCEADGRVWWWDETRQLNVWGGGVPTQIPCPLRLATIERVSDREIGRAYMVPNTGYGEVILWYPRSNADLPDTALVYNYAAKAWTLWDMQRPAYSQRVGAIRPIAADDQNRLYQHDLDVGLGASWLEEPFAATPLGSAQLAVLSDVEPYDWALTSNLVVSQNPTREAFHLDKVLVDNLPNPAPGIDDSLSVTLKGFGAPTRRLTLQRTYEDTVTLTGGEPIAEMRVGGRALQLGLAGTGHRTVWRFGEIGFIPEGDGER